MALLWDKKNIRYAPGSPGFSINMLLESATFINCEDKSRSYRPTGSRQLREDDLVKARHVLLLGSVYIQNIHTYKLFIQLK